MAIIIKPPAALPSHGYSIFLAGSIEMGEAENWQEKIEKELSAYNITILNPRREAWDKSWKQSIDNPPFLFQVTWELTGQEISNLICMYFDPATKAPITLLELGLFAKTGKVIVCCPDGYWRKGNVEIVCQKFQIPCFNTFDEFVHEIKNRINRR